MESKKRQVAWYINDDNSRPAFDYIWELSDPDAIAILINVIQMLVAVGIEKLINTNMCDEIESPIYELRKDRHRILFGRDGNLFILLSGFYKKTQKTPIQEIDLAKKRWKSYIKNQQFELIRLAGKK